MKRKKIVKLDMEEEEEEERDFLDDVECGKQSFL